MQNLVSAIVGGIIVSLFGYYALTDRPGAPSVTVTRGLIGVSSEIAKSVAEQLRNSASKPPQTITSSSFYSGAIVETFRIENDGDEILKRVVISAKGYETVIVHLPSGVVVSSNDLLREAEMSPGDAIEVVTISNGTIYESLGVIGVGRVQVSVDNKVMPVTELSIATYKEFAFLAYFAGTYPFAVFMLMGTGVIAVLVLIIAGTIDYVTRDNVEFKLKSTRDEVLVMALRMYFFVRQSDPHRAERIKRAFRRAQKA